MIRERPRSFGCVAQIEQHQKLFLFRETKRLCGGFRIQEIDPAAVHALVGSRQGKVRGDDRCVLDAGIALPAGIGEDIFTVKCDGQNPEWQRASPPPPAGQKISCMKNASG